MLKCKRILAMLLSLVLLLSNLPALPGILAVGAEAEPELVWQTFEAEDSTYTAANLYTSTESNTAYSNGKALAGGNQANNQDYSALAAGYLDKSNTAYVAFFVDAPENGTYKLKLSYKAWWSSAYTGTPYAAFVVNGTAYKADFTGAKQAVGDTQEVEVGLRKGINTIYCVVLTADQNPNKNAWANIDRLQIYGDSRLAGVKAQTVDLLPANSQAVHNYGSFNSNGSIGGGSWGEKLPIDAMSYDNIHKTKSFTFTVNAPKDGYYDITGAFGLQKNSADRAIGLLVDGVPPAREYDYFAGQETTDGGKGLVDLSVYLTAGEHLLTVTAPTKRTAEDTCGNAFNWADYTKLTLRGGLTLAKVQRSSDGKYKLLQANDSSVAFVHGYANLSSSNSNATDRLVVGGGSYDNGQTLSQIESFFDRDTNAYLEFVVEAPEAGTYDVALRSSLNLKNVSGSPQLTAQQAYVTFLVNGKTVVTAGFGGTSGNYDTWMSDTPTKLPLEKGRNIITVLPISGDMIVSGGTGTWADVDCLKIDPSIEAVSVKEDTVLTPKDAQFINQYKNIKDSFVGTCIIAHAKEKGIYAKNLADANGTVDRDKLANVPYVSYTVSAPVEGYYTVTQAFSGKLKNITGYDDVASMLAVVNGQVQVAKFETDDSGNGKVSFTVKLEKGSNVLTFTMQMPNVKDGWSGYWTDLKELTLTGGLSLAQTQINPLTGDKDLVLEAEDGYYYKYNIEENAAYSGGKALGFGDTAKNITWEELQGYMDKSNTAYALLQVEAPEEGDYYIRLGYKFKDNSVTGDFTSYYNYAAFLVNGKRYRAEFMGRNGTLAESASVKVHLVKGINTITCIPLTGDLCEEAGNDCWANIDCLYADNRLKAVNSTESVRKDADDCQITNLFGNKADHDGDKYFGTALYNLAKREKLSVADLMDKEGKINKDNLVKVPYVAYTVTAPKAGYYDISMLVAGNFDGPAGYVGYGVDGVMQPRLFELSENATWNTYGAHYIDLSVYLTEGDHTLTVTGHLPADEAAAETSRYGWCDLGPIILRGGLTLTNNQNNPLTGAAGGDKLMQAETDAFYNYFNMQNRTQALEGATVVGDADTKYNPTYAELENQLKEGLFDKSALSYLGFAVSAPKAGEYYVKLRYQMKDGADADAYPADPYVAVVVNGKRAYKTYYAGPKNKLRDTAYVKVTLDAGINMLYCMPMLKDLADAYGTDAWANVDYLAIDSRLTPVSPAKLELLAYDAQYINRYNRTENGADKYLGGAQKGQANANKIYIEGITQDNLADVPFFSYTVQVEKDGYYDATLLFAGANEADTNAIGLIVDGAPQAVNYRYKSDAEKSARVHQADLSVYLTAGRHQIIVTMQLPATQQDAVAYRYEWTDMVKLTFHGGVTKANKQVNPLPYTTDPSVQDPGNMTVVEAEDDTKVFANKYEKVGTDGNKSYLEGGDYEKLVSDKSLLEGLDKSNTAYAGLTVNAPAEGAYAIRVSYGASLSNFDEDNKPYAVILVNGIDVYKTRLNSTNGQIGLTDVIQVDLTAGYNTVYVMLLSEEVIRGNSEYDAVLDAIHLDASLEVVPADTVTAQAGDMFSHLYNSRGNGYLKDSDTKAAKVLRPNAESLTVEDLRNLPFAAYTVVAPADGYYDISMYYAGTAETVLGGMVDGKVHPFRVTHHYDMFDGEGKQTVYWSTAGYHQVDLSMYLTAGTHTIVVTMELPRTAADAESFKYSWTDLGPTTFHGGLKLAQEQVNPLASGMTMMEAEDWCSRNYYDKISDNWKYSGGRAATNGGGTRQTDTQLAQHLDKKEQSYIEYMVSAPAAGKYALLVGVQIGGSKDFPEGFVPYVWLWVNGKLISAKSMNSKGSISCIPVTVDLSAGSNVIRVIGATKNMTNLGIWFDHDYLIVDSRLTPMEVPSVKKVEAEKAAYFNHYVASERKSASGGAIMGASSPSAAMAGVTTKNLSLDNLDAVSYLSFTVYAPHSGYYTIAGRVHMDKGERYGKLGLMVDGKTHIFGMHQNKWGDQNYAEAAVYLTAGTHVIVTTGLLGDTFPNYKDVLWIDYDYIELGNGLRLASEQKAPATSTKFTRFEAENYAVTNMYQRNAVYEEMSGGYCNYANTSVTVQSYEQIAASGISNKDTPFVKYRVDAPEAGTYTVRVGMSFKHNGKIEQDTVSIAVIINGQAQEVKLPLFTNNYCKPFPLTMKLTLEEGVNELIFTGALAELNSPDAYVNLHYDYLDVTGGLTARSLGQRIEAEHAENNCYISVFDKRSSGNQRLGEEDWDSVWTNDLTLENLSIRNYMAMPWVRYTVVAEEDGIYEISIGFSSDGSVEQEQVFFGMSVNDGAYQKVWYNKMWRNSIIVEVELKKGDNTILLTGATKDFMNFPEYPSQKLGYNLWCDHDYLDLAPGLSAVAKDERPAWTGDKEAAFRQDLQGVWDATYDPAEESRESNWILWVGIGGGLTALLTVFFLILGKKKKSEKN